MRFLFSIVFLISINTFAIPKKLRELREDARIAVSESQCARCHTPSTTKKPEALKIYNLAKKNWSSTMTDAHLIRLSSILKDATADEIIEMGGDPHKNTLSKKETDIIVKFVEEELKFRSLRPNHRFKEIQMESYSDLFKMIGRPDDEDCA